MDEEGKELMVDFLMQQLEIEDCNALHKSPVCPKILLHMTVDRTRPRATKRTEVMDRFRDRIILEHKDLLILVISLENLQGWRISA